jgi:cell division protein FtsQ
MKNKTTRSKKPNISLRRKIAAIYSKMMLALKLALLLFLLVFFGTNYFKHFKQGSLEAFYNFSRDIGFEIKILGVSGNVNLSKDEISTIAIAPVNYPIFKIDIKQLHKKLATNPWIKDVIIQRRLPDTIHIILREREPIAIWQVNQELFLIDERGHKITADYNGRKFSGLLHVVGGDANIHASSLLDYLKKAPELRAKLISAVRYGQRRWDLNFIQDITVKMPEHDFAIALEYLIKLNTDHKLFDQNYKTLDLRDSGKYYIES